MKNPYTTKQSHWALIYIFEIVSVLAQQKHLRKGFTITSPHSPVLYASNTLLMDVTGFIAEVVGAASKNPLACQWPGLQDLISYANRSASLKTSLCDKSSDRILKQIDDHEKRGLPLEPKLKSFLNTVRKLLRIKLLMEQRRFCLEIALKLTRGYLNEVKNEDSRDFCGSQNRSNGRSLIKAHASLQGALAQIEVLKSLDESYERTRNDISRQTAEISSDRQKSSEYFEDHCNKIEGEATTGQEKGKPPPYER